MWNKPTLKRLSKIPDLKATEDVPVKDKKVYLHFFIGGCDWYVVEYDKKDTFFGFAILNNDVDNAEWGYFSFIELLHLKIGFVEVDCEKTTYFPVQKISKISRINNLWQCK